MIGWVCGSQFAMIWPASTSSPSRTEMHRAVGQLVRSRSRPMFVDHDPDSPERETATRSPVCACSTVLRLCKRIVPACFTWMLSTAANGTGGTTDVEGTHGQLRARLTDGLRGDNADRLTNVDAVTTSEIAAVACSTDAVAGVAGDRRTHSHLVDAELFELLDPASSSIVPASGNTSSVPSASSTSRAHAAQDALASGSTTSPPSMSGVINMPLLGTAVNLGDHQVLRDVHQTTGQVTRVRRLQRRIGQTFARAVGRDEVLQTSRPSRKLAVIGVSMMEPSGLAIRPRIPASWRICAAEPRAPESAIHEDRVEGLLLDLFAVASLHGLGTELIHHGLGDLVVRPRPDVDHLVVARPG